MNAIAEQKRRLRGAVRSGLITQAELARAAGLSRSMLTGMMDETWNPRAKTLERLVEALDRLGFFCPTRTTRLEMA